MSLAVVASASALALFNPVTSNPKAPYVNGRFPGPGEASDVRPGYVSGLPGDVRAHTPQPDPCARTFSLLPRFAYAPAHG